LLRRYFRAPRFIVFCFRCRDAAYYEYAAGATPMLMPFAAAPRLMPREDAAMLIDCLLLDLPLLTCRFFVLRFLMLYTP